MEELYTAYIITMKTRNGKKLYLTEQNGKYVWSFYRNEGLWWKTEQDAEEFCKNYFIKFSNWSLETVSY